MNELHPDTCKCILSGEEYWKFVLPCDAHKDYGTPEEIISWVLSENRARQYAAAAVFNALPENIQATLVDSSGIPYVFDENRDICLIVPPEMQNDLPSFQGKIEEKLQESSAFYPEVLWTNVTVKNEE